MNRFVIDTNVYSAFKAGEAGVLACIRSAEAIVVCPTVHGELLAGFKCGAREKRNVSEFEEFLDRPRVCTVSIDATTATFYGEIFRQLRSKGSPVPTNDMWIAASAMQHGLAVCTLDAHFRNIDGLIVVFP